VEVVEHALKVGPIRVVYNLSYKYDDTSMDELRKRLESLGLGGHEPAVYAALLEQSPAGAATLARRCGLSRSSVYTTLSALTAKGLVGTTHAHEVKQFVAEGHGALVDLMRREQSAAAARVAAAERLSAELGRLAEAAAAQAPQIVTFEGQQGLKRIYLGMLRAAPRGATLRLLRDEFVWRDDWRFVFEREWRERVGRLKQEKELATELLVNASPVERAHAAYYRTRPLTEVRVLRQPVRGFGLYLAGDTAAILSLESRELIGVRIVNRHIAANLDAIFGALWRTGRPATRGRR
jgi:transcriptional regulator TrmB